MTVKSPIAVVAAIVSLAGVCSGEVVIPLYGDYAEGFWDRSLKSMPGSYKESFLMRPARTSSVIATEQLGAQKAEDAKGAEKYPYFTCELGGGMASSYHRRFSEYLKSPIAEFSALWYNSNREKIVT